MVKRGEIWWAALPPPVGSAPGFRRPVLVVQTDIVNSSRLRTVIVVGLSSNLELSTARGNVLLPFEETGLPTDSVVNLSQILTVDRRLIEERIGQLTPGLMSAVNAGLRMMLDL